MFLNEKYNFNNYFINENCNVLKIAKKIAKKQYNIYNPIIFCGSVGSGKTHLLNAIGNKLIKKYKTIYITFDEYLNDWREHCYNQKYKEFRKKYY